METVGHFTPPKLTRSGIDLGNGPIPLISGSLHYFRVPKQYWRLALDGLKRLGVGIVQSCVPWSFHQESGGDLTFSGDNERDLPAFLEAVQGAGLYASLSVGPSVNAELTGFGIPQDVLWDEQCQARSSQGAPVMVPALPRVFPAPSFASSAFLSEAQLWLEGVAQVLAPFAFPKGPVILLELDTASFHFRDALYDQDYHPDAITAYRAFIQARYGSVGELRNVYGDSGLSIENLKPPERLSAHSAQGLVRHLDWAEFQEHSLAVAVDRFRKSLNYRHLAELPVCLAQPKSAPHAVIDPALLSESVNLTGQNFGAVSDPRGRRKILHQTSALVTRAQHRGTPAFATELSAGSPPQLGLRSDSEAEFAALTALAYGVNAFNIYMAVERDRWIGAPVGQRGQSRPGFEFWQRLLAAIQETELCALTRKVEVHVVVPRSYLRLCRTLNALGPLNLGVLSQLGGEPDDAATEDALGLNHPVIQDVEQFLRTLEAALERAGIPYAVCSDDNFDFAVNHGRWTLIASTGSLPAQLLQKIATAIQLGRALSVGPHDPVRDERWKPITPGLAVSQGSSTLPVWIGSEPKLIQDAVKIFANLPDVFCTLADSPAHTTLFHDPSEQLRVGFAMNADPFPKDALFSSLNAAVDVITKEAFESLAGKVRVPLAPKSARMLKF